MPSQPDDLDRYDARTIGVVNWCVWDTRRNEPVFGSDMLSEDEAREAAPRLSQAYRRAMSPVDIVSTDVSVTQGTTTATARIRHGSFSALGTGCAKPH